MVGVTTSWAEALDLVEELQRDPGSHLLASLAGWAWVPAAGELLLTTLVESYINTHRAEKQDAVILARPWDAVEDEEDDLTPEARTALIEDFQRRSAMRDL